MYVVGALGPVGVAKDATLPSRHSGSPRDRERGFRVEVDQVNSRQSQNLWLRDCSGRLAGLCEPFGGFTEVGDEELALRPGKAFWEGGKGVSTGHECQKFHIRD